MTVASHATVNAGTTLTAPPFLMRMGCTNELITFRTTGNEGVCLQSPEHGVQQIAHFNPAVGDLLGLDDVLERTQAHANLSDVASYITTQLVNGGTMLYVDTTGQGLQGTPFAFLQGVSTNLSQLVANGGIAYVPDRITVQPAFNTTTDLRPDGLTTVHLAQIAPGIGPVMLEQFSAAMGDNIELANILNHSQALPNLSNVASYIHASTTNGNTTLSVDLTGTGQAGTPFAVLEGVTTTVAQLMSSNALLYDPTNINQFAQPNMTFVYRSAGAETAVLGNVQGNVGATQLSGFSLAAGDGISVMHILDAANLQTDLSNINNYISTVETGGNTQLWFDPNGSGHGGTLEAVIQNTSVTMDNLLAHSALHLSFTT